MEIFIWIIQLNCFYFINMSVLKQDIRSFRLSISPYWYLKIEYLLLLHVFFIILSNISDKVRIMV